MAETISSAELGAIQLTETMLTKKGVEELVATVRKGGITPKGSCAFASLPTPAEAKLGWMYNVSDAFTTTADWVEGAGKKYPAGTNVYVCNPSGSTYKWDALPGEGLQLSTDAPKPNGGAAAGSALTAARADHVHPTDTTRAAAADLTSHTNNTSIHVTAAEKAIWDGKADPYSEATQAAAGLMSASDKTKLDGIASGANVGFATVGTSSKTVAATANASKILFDGTNVSVSVSEGNQTGGGAAVSISVADGSTEAKGVVQLENSTSSTSTTKAATANAVKVAKDAADAAATSASGALARVAAIEAAAGTLLTNLSNAALADASMTSANTIKTAVLALIDFLKAFAASSDNNAATTHTPAS